MFPFLGHLYTKQFVEVTMSAAYTNTPLLPLLEEPLLLWAQIEAASISMSTPAIFSSCLCHTQQHIMLYAISTFRYFMVKENHAQ